MRSVRARVLPSLRSLAGCTVGPDYSRPRVDAPATSGASTTRRPPRSRTREWWEQFGDPALNQLIDEALRENRDVRIAAARVDQFLGALTTTRSQFYPADRLQRRREPQPREPRRPAAARARRRPVLHALPGRARARSWQIDLFGRVRRQSEAAQAQVLRERAGAPRRGPVARHAASPRATSTLRALDRQLEIARATAQNYAETRELFELRFKGGVVSRGRARAGASRSTSRRSPRFPRSSSRSPRRRTCSRSCSAATPGRSRAARRSTSSSRPAIPADLPSELLERRPDILQAEQNLVAANAQHRRGEGALLPDHLAHRAARLGEHRVRRLPDRAGARVELRRASPARSSPFGAIEGQVRAAEAAQREALAFYQQAILNAFRETNDALVGTLKKRDESRRRRRKRVARAARVRAALAAAVRQRLRELPRGAVRRERAVQRRARPRCASQAERLHAARQRLQGGRRRLGERGRQARAAAAWRGRGCRPRTPTSPTSTVPAVFGGNGESSRRRDSVGAE